MTTPISQLRTGNTATKDKPDNNKLVELKGFMERLKPQMALALPKHLTADRMVRLALTAFSSSEQLQRCTNTSIAASIMTAVQLGLEPGVNGAGFLVPYGNICTFIPGWKGLVDLVSRSGRGTVFTGVIYKDQEYTFVDGAKRDLIIHNETDLDSPDDITHAYSIGLVKDATMPIIELWRVSKIKKHRDKYNKQGSKHYSFRDWEMYARKVPLLQVLKYMPCSIEVANALALSEAADMGRGATIEGGFVVEYDAPEGVDAETGEIISRKNGVIEHQKQQPQTIPQQMVGSTEQRLAFAAEHEKALAETMAMEERQEGSEQQKSPRQAGRRGISLE